MSETTFLNPDVCANCWHTHGLPLEDRWADWCKDSLCGCVKFQSGRALITDLLAALEFALPFVPVPSGRPSEPTAYVEGYNRARAAIAAVKGEA